MKIKHLLSMLLLIVLIASGCQSNNKDIIEVLEFENESYLKKIQVKEDEIKNLSNEVIKLEEQINHLNNASYFTNALNQLIWGDSLFDPEEIKVGDIVSDMKLIAIDGSNYIFEGQKIVEGRLTIWEDEIYKNMISISVDNTNANCLPRATNDLRVLWFKFDNRDEAYDIFTGDNTQDYVKVLIDNYIVALKESDVINSAILINKIKD